MPVKKTPAKKAIKTKTTAKKVTKKAVAKKTPAKKPKKVSSKKTPKDLVYAADGQSFWVTNGEILNSLIALRDALSEMEKEVYLYHAMGDQNDFSLWVSDVLCDEACAADLEKAKTPKSARTVVVKHLKLYSA